MFRAIDSSGSGERCAPPAASRCSARKLAARSFPRGPPARGASRLFSASYRPSGTWLAVRSAAASWPGRQRSTQFDAQLAKVVVPALRPATMASWRNVRARSVRRYGLPDADQTATCLLPVRAATRREAPLAGGRRGKERAASLRAEQRLAAGGAQRSPDPDESIARNIAGSPDPDKYATGDFAGLPTRIG